MSTNESTKEEESPYLYRLPNNDFATYLVGGWKRNLEWRDFGGNFGHRRTFNTFVSIVDNGQDEDGTKYLKWSFGKSFQVEHLRFGYIMKFSPNTRGQHTKMEWRYSDTTCHGKFIPETGIASFQYFTAKATVVVTYRVCDADTIALCIVEVDSKNYPTVQYGNMYRIDQSLYDDLLPEGQTN
eukprot:GFYU01019058.1.p1 GENE.GFYU01019058.1~~GFYU01019058.1.p1  ORF type:complete len:183 (-),score=36.68 GFYU01019058.1:687-1235(-)